MNRPHDRSRLRSRTLAILGVLALATTVACSSESTQNDPTTQNPPPDQGGQLGNGKPSKIDPAANGSDFMSPFDATPDLDGKTVYFTGLTREGDPGVFKVDAKGGAITKLFVGEPLSTPFGIAMSEDGKTLLIADSGAARSETEEGGNVFTLSIEGGTPSVLAGTEGTRPRGLEVKGDQVYFTGKKDGKAGLFTVGVGGGVATAVVAGEPFADPSGVAIRKNGEVYVADSSPEGEAGSAIIRVADGKAELFQTGIAVGHPAGVALSQDDNALLISGIEPEKGTDIVYRIDLASKEMTTFDAVIKDFMESAGLHRAKKAEVYAWADSRANKGGTVYVLSN